LAGKAEATPYPAPRVSEAAEAWVATKDTASIPALELFIASYKDSYYAGLARLRIEELKKQQPAAIPPSRQPAVAVPPTPPPPSQGASGEIHNFFGQVGDQIYEDCIFELSQEQLEAQQALIEAYIKQGADRAVARQLAAKQIQPRKLSPECEQMRALSKSARPRVPTPAVPPQIAETPSNPRQPTTAPQKPFRWDEKRGLVND